VRHLLLQVLHGLHQGRGAVFGILAVDDAQFLDGLRTVREIGRPAMAMVHAENMSIIHNLKARCIEAGRDDLKAWTDARPDLAEEEATGGPSGTARRRARACTSST
jgi:hypothetical protein